jgi:hypothetical protein
MNKIIVDVAIFNNVFNKLFITHFKDRIEDSVGKRIWVYTNDKINKTDIFSKL